MNHWGGGWSTKVVNGPYGVSLWKNIRSERDKFSRFVTFQIGTGAQIKFWLDVWCGDKILKDTFPELYRTARDKDADVADLLQFHNGSIYWEVVFMRAIHDWESDSISTFFDQLYSINVREQNEDKIC